MAGTRSAPTVDGTGSYTRVSVSLIDASGDLRSESLRIPGTATDAEIEDYVAKLQLVSMASIYQVTVTEVYYSNPAVGNADNNPRASNFQNIVTLAKDASADSVSYYIPAPDDALFLANSDAPDTTVTAYVNFRTSTDLILNGGAAGSGTFAAIASRYSERKEINEKVSI